MHTHNTNSRHYTLWLPLVLFYGVILFICNSTLCIGQQRWNIELKNDIKSQVVNTNPPTLILSIASDRMPQLVEVGNGKTKLRVYTISGTIEDLDIERVIRITSTSDPLEPPTIHIIGDVPEPDSGCCCCQNKGFLVFDRFEIRGMVGYRGRDTSGILLQTTSDGSSFIFGLEFTGLWSLDSRNAFQIGPMIGVWPTDGSIFVPVSIHPRYTFPPASNTENEPAGGSQWFVYGDIGVPFDFQTDAPLLGSTPSRQRLFYGVGIGVDCIWGCLALDAGIRRIHLPLVLDPNEAVICPNCPPDQRHPYRLSTLLYLRFGITL